MVIIYFIFASVNGLNPMRWEGDWKSAYVSVQIMTIVCVCMGVLMTEDSKKN